jgi:hypothetical protein
MGFLGGLNNCINKKEVRTAEELEENVLEFQVVAPATAGVNEATSDA